MTWKDNLYPKTWKARAKANENLTGARTHWSLYHERTNIKVAWVVLFGLTFISLLANTRAYGDIVFLIGVPLTAFLMIIISFGIYWDELAIIGPKVKPSPYEERPFRPNLHLWLRTPPVTEKNAETLSEPDPEPQAPPRPEPMGIVFCGNPEGYPALKPTDAFPPDADVIVGHLLEDADFLTQTETIDEEGAAKRMGFGIGYWNGKMYIVPGKPLVCILGRQGLARGIQDHLLRRFFCLCPTDLRAEIYESQPNSRWFRRVYYYMTKPIDPKRPLSGQVDEHLAMKLAATEANLELRSDEVETLTTEYMKMVNVKRRI